jgi:hypothetical protein
VLIWRHIVAQMFQTAPRSALSRPKVAAHPGVIESPGHKAHVEGMMMFSFHKRFLPAAGKLLNRR